MLKKITIGAILAASAMTAAPTAAVASHDGYYDRGGYERSYRDDRRYNDRRYSDSRYYQGRTYRGDRHYRNRRCSGTTGTIVGGAGGALLGREIAGRGSRTTGLILGGAVGALLGREVGKSTCRR